MDAAQEEKVRVELATPHAQIMGQLASLNSRMETLIGQNKDLKAELRDLREYVEKIETEAHEAMTGMMDPDKMMEMAGKFMGLK